jgi:hypothetical protein
MKKQKRRSLIEAEQQMEALLKRVGYTGKYAGNVVNEIPNYKVEVKNPTSDQVPGGSYKRYEPKYSGGEILGVTLNHKSNYEPVRKDNKQAAIDSAHMRRN